MNTVWPMTFKRSALKLPEPFGLPLGLPERPFLNWPARGGLEPVGALSMISVLTSRGWIGTLCARAGRARGKCHAGPRAHGIVAGQEAKGPQFATGKDAWTLQLT